jgi:hypothetical protein
MVRRYGQPSTMKEYCDKMQLMNATGYQGIFEAAGHKLNEIGGVMLWKLNAAFPSVVWQVYDWYLMPNAGYYFMQNACEPVHIQFNVKDLNVEYINRTYMPAKSLTAQAEVFNLQSESLFRKTEEVNLEAPEAKEGFSLADVIKKNDGVSFVVLNLNDSQGKTISHNVYWLSNTNDFTSLGTLPATDVTVKITGTSQLKNEIQWTMQISNESGRIAFFINPRLLSGGEEVAPSFWSVNYFTLAPHETISVRVGCPPSALGNYPPVLRIESWNTGIKEINLPLK